MATETVTRPTSEWKWRALDCPTSGARFETCLPRRAILSIAGKVNGNTVTIGGHLFYPGNLQMIGMYVSTGRWGKRMWHVRVSLIPALLLPKTMMLYGACEWPVRTMEAD